MSGLKSNVGIYNLHMQTMGGGERLTLALAERLSLSHNVWLFHTGALDVTSLQLFFGVDMSRVTVIPLSGPGQLLRIFAKIRGRRSPALSLHHYLQIRKYDLDLFLNNTYASGLVCPAARGIYMCMFPYKPAPQDAAGGLAQQVRDRIVDWVEKRFTGFNVHEVADSYSHVVAISYYSAEWVRKIWGRRAEVIYPPCDDMGPLADKEKSILHVGRFVPDNGEAERHHKGQGLLLETFKRMTDLHQQGWELHFSGSAGGDEESVRFTEALTQSAKGFPVSFHFNAGLEELRDLYRRAAVYWHATGYGFPAEDYPARQEHFGITTVEAMSAGAVPVVFGSGGQTEIVTHGVDGFCWDDTSDLAALTLRLAYDTSLRARLGRQAVSSSRRFSKEAFAASLDLLVDQLLSGDPAIKDH